MISKVLSFFSNWQVKVAIVFIVITSAFAWYKIDVSHQVEKARYEVRTEIQQRYNARIDKLKEDSNNTQKVMKESFDTQLKEKNEKLKVADSKYRNLLSGLSDRPERPSSSYGLSLPPRDAKSSVYVDARGLYRDDAEFLSRFAARTEGLKIELLACYKQYDEAKRILDEFKEDHKP